MTDATTSVIHRLSQEILNFSMYMLGCKVALEPDLSIGALFKRRTYLDVLATPPHSPHGVLVMHDACPILDADA